MEVEGESDINKKKVEFDREEMGELMCRVEGDGMRVMGKAKCKTGM